MAEPLHHVQISQGGVLPNVSDSRLSFLRSSSSTADSHILQIESALLPQRTPKKAQKQADEDEDEDDQ